MARLLIITAVLAAVALGLLGPAVAGERPAPWTLWALFALFGGAALLGCFAIVGAISLPASPNLTPLDDEEVNNSLTPAILERIEALEQLGYTLIGSPMRLNTSPQALVVPLLHDSGQVYGTVYTIEELSRTAFIVTSILDNGGGLMTSDDADAANVPQAPGEFMQIFPKADAATLHHEHMAALTWLETERLRARRLTADAYETDFRQAMVDGRNHFLSRPLRNAAVILWRTAAGSPHRARLEDQAPARKSLTQIREWPMPAPPPSRL